MTFLRGFTLLLLVSLPAFAAPEPFYIGTYTQISGSKGIYSSSLDRATGKLGPIMVAAPANDPSFLALSPDGGALYAAEEVPGPGFVESWKRDNSGKLTPLNKQGAGGDGTCFVSVDPSGHYVLAANYGSGNFSCFRLNADGSVGPRTGFMQMHGSGPNKARQEGSHAHSIYVTPDEKFVYACDLGTDCVWVFKFDKAAGTLALGEPPAGRVAPGSGARHLAFSRDGRHIYVASELGHTVTVFRRDPATGSLTQEQVVTTVDPKTPSAPTAPAEIILHPNGKWLYVSNRLCDTISIFAVDASAKIHLVQTVPAGVKCPRSMALDPSGGWIMTAGQEDNHLSVLKLDRATGQLTPTAETAQVPCPVCILFAPKG